MKQTSRLALVVALASVFLSLVLSVPAQNTKSLKVKATYSGTGTVSETHKIHLYLFDTPDLMSGPMPISWNSISKNGESVTFSGLTAKTVYMTVAYGDYDITMGPPPSGTPVTFYQPGSPSPSPIELTDNPLEIEIEFDDTIRMP